MRALSGNPSVVKWADTLGRASYALAQLKVEQLIHLCFTLLIGTGRSQTTSCSESLPAELW